MQRPEPAGRGVCQACGAQIKKADVLSVTAHACGIEVEGGAFEIIIPKSSPYPTLEAHVRTFYTAQAAQEIIMIPVYLGLGKEQARDNQYLGSAPIRLSEQVPAETPVEVSFELDRNGVLTCRAEALFGAHPKCVAQIDPAQGQNALALPEMIDSGDIGGQDGGGLPEAERWKQDCIIFYHIALARCIRDNFGWLLSDNDRQQVERNLAAMDTRRVHQ